MLIPVFLNTKDATEIIQIIPSIIILPSVYLILPVKAACESDFNASNELLSCDF